MSGPETTKLKHVLSKLLASKKFSVDDSAESVVRTLLESFAEYQKKPQVALQKLVKEELRSMKDAMRAAEDENTPGGSSSLNASLRDQYVGVAPAAKPVGERTKRRRVNVGGGTAVKKESKDSDDDEDDTFALVLDPPTERLSDVAGAADAVQSLREIVAARLIYGSAVASVGMQAPRGVLVHGPYGCGKTLLCRAAAGSASEALEKDTGKKLSYFECSASLLFQNNNAEKRLKKLFTAAAENAPSIVLLEELDLVISQQSSSTTNGKESSSRAEARLCAAFDTYFKNDEEKVLVLTTAASGDALGAKSRLRCFKRFDREVALGVPDSAAREVILRGALGKVAKLCCDVNTDFIKEEIVKKTPGWLGADLIALAFESGNCAARRLHACHVLDEITSVDLTAALSRVQPKFSLSGFSRPPEVNWEDVGAMVAVKDELADSILTPISEPQKFAALGIPLPAGVLLYGPPGKEAVNNNHAHIGCGKTLVARAVAHESAANFIAVKGPELLDKYVGESERAVRALFARASASAPCIVFFDEIDALCPRRGGLIGSAATDSGGSGGVSERVVNQLLTELDGLESRGQVYVVAATNRPELVDPAMLRPGRIDKLLFVPLPTAEDRTSILRATTKKVKLGPDVDIEAIARDTRADGYSGADIAALVRDAGLTALRDSEAQISNRHFQTALDRLQPSVNATDAAAYAQLATRMRGGNNNNPHPPPPAVVRSA